MSNLAVVALARAIKDKATAQAVAENWKMSNDEVKQLLWTVDMRDRTDLRDFEFKKMIVRDEKVREWVYDLLISFDDYDTLKRMQAWETPVFPVNGNDLIQIGFKPGPDLGKALNGLREVWIDLNFEKTRDELLSYIM
jgi:tRNA nucleotidyltransferase/poly(A) polymerase